MTSLLPLLTARAALVPALALAALGCTALADTDAPAPADGPVACILEIDRDGGLTVIEGVVTADRALTGSYALAVTRGGARINQGGPLTPAPGETLRLGEVRLNGPASGLAAELTLTLGGRDYACASDL